MAYTLCLMFESSHWVDDYLKDGWRKQYENFLLQREETKNLARCEEFNKKSGPYNRINHAKAVGHHPSPDGECRTPPARNTATGGN